MYFQKTVVVQKIAWEPRIPHNNRIPENYFPFWISSSSPRFEGSTTCNCILRKRPEMYRLMWMIQICTSILGLFCHLLATRHKGKSIIAAPKQVSFFLADNKRRRGRINVGFRKWGQISQYCNVMVRNGRCSVSLLAQEKQSKFLLQFRLRAATASSSALKLSGQHT